MGRTQEALRAYRGGLADALFFNLEAYAEALSLLHPFFVGGWASPSADIGNVQFSFLVADAAEAFWRLGQPEQSLMLHEIVMKIDLKFNYWKNLRIDLSIMANILAGQNRLALRDKYIRFELELAESMDDDAHLFRARFNRFAQLTEMGRWAAAEALWRQLDPMGRDWPPALYRTGMAEEAYARFQFWQGRLTEDLLAEAERLARSGRNRNSVRLLSSLCAEWRLERGEWALAVESLYEAIRMTREAGINDTQLETWLALARFQLGQLPAAREEAIRLSNRRDPSHLALAELWHVIGDPGEATQHALAAYGWAWADGEPYVHRHELSRAADMLRLLGAENPKLRAYDPADDQPVTFEDQVRAVIERLRARRGTSPDTGEQSGP